ncbi:MAG: low temperature requirement protein A [Rhodoglobus sp.]
MSAPDSSARRRAPALRGDGAKVTPLELFFDLIFVLALTQCTALMAADLSWLSIAEGLMVLAMLWWAWVGYSWLTSVVDPEEGEVRIAIFASMAAMLVASLCVPDVFGDTGLLFACAYAAVRIGQVALFILASGNDPDLRRAVMGLALSTALGIAPLFAASFTDGWVRLGLWALALALDYIGPIIINLSGWKLSAEHFAERHRLIVIIALGESIVAIGIGAQQGIDITVVVAAALGMAVCAALWWVYFDVVALVSMKQLAQAAVGREQNALARDSFSYLHFPMVAGIVLVALGLKKTLAHTGDHLSVESASALFGGTALYLLALALFRRRNVGGVNWPRVFFAGLLCLLIPVVIQFSAIVALGVLTVLLILFVIYEVHTYAEARTRIRAELRH